MASSAPAPPTPHRVDVVRTAAVWSRWIAVIALAAGGVIAALGPAMSWTQPLVLAVAGVGFVAGLPHGAVDHVLLGRSVGRPLPVAAAGYALLAVLAWVLLRWGGPAPLVAVAVLSVVHFGTGELEAQRADGHGPKPVVAAMTAVAATGALLLPLARSGADMRDVAAALSPGLGEAIASGAVRAALAAVWLVAACVTGVSALRAGRTAVLLDVVLVGALGVLLPPLVAFALWFGGWHALRHAGRLLTVEPGSAVLVRAGRTRDAVCRLARLAAVPSIAAVVTLAVIAGYAATAADLSGAVAEALRILLALTVPHMLVVTWMDRQRLTTTGAGPS
jgi:beta-carotene 15,15'-dioxygenase